MIAFHGDPAIKAKYLKRVKMHTKLDHLKQGVGWEKNGHTKGCAVGCTLERTTTRTMRPNWGYQSGTCPP
jgi:hypothetical protein